MQTRVSKKHEVCTIPGEAGYQLCLQWVCYNYGDNAENFPKDVYRFIWKNSDGNLMPTLGQARIPSLKVASVLIALAVDQGWGAEKAEDADDIQFDLSAIE